MRALVRGVAVLGFAGASKVMASTPLSASGNAAAAGNAGTEEPIVAPSSPGSTGAASPDSCPNWQVVRTASISVNGMVKGTENLFYDSCSRDVKAQTVGDYNYNGTYYSGAAEIYYDEHYYNPCFYYAGHSCTTSARTDAGIKSKAYGIINTPYGDATGLTYSY